MSTKKIAIIDLDSVCYTIGHGNKITLPDGSFKKEGNRLVYQEKTDSELIDAANKVMSDILRSCGATHYIGYMKGFNTTDSRKAINPNYKAQRSTEPPKWWNFVQNQLHLEWKAVYVDDIEVDDAVNITKLQLSDSFIVAIDKDLLSLPGTHYNWRKGEWTTVASEEAAYRFWSDMIVGQPIDNVKGIPGKGEAFTKKLFEQESNYPNATFNAYIKFFGVDSGIKEFYKNYVSLRLLDYAPNFSIPLPVESPTIKQIQQEEFPL